MNHRWKAILFGLLGAGVLLLAAGCGSSGDSNTASSEDDSTFTVSVMLLDQAGNETRTISEGDPGILRVTVKTASGSSAANQFLTVTTTKGSFLNSDGTAITDSNGVAEFTLSAADANGAGTIDVTVGDTSLDLPFAFQIGVPASVKLGTFVGGTFQEGVLTSSIALGQELSIGGTATITASLAFLDGTVYVPYTKSVDITFTTGCSTAVVGAVVATENGNASTNYRADGCTSGTDRVTATASIAGSTITASVDLLLARPEVGSISFVSAEPTHMALAGTSNSLFQTTSVVTFLVKDEAANFVPNELVKFSLSTAIGGISISPLSAETNSEGMVQTIVTSGNVPTSVRVNATVNDSQITTVSNTLVISTGLPDQNSFSLGVETLNPESLDIDGVEVVVTVRAGDHFNNPVPDGTSIYFTTNGGVVEPSCETDNGVCSVTWRSQDPRPESGRAIILATALGEEAFIDANGSGRYESSADNFSLQTNDMTEAFVDVNENGSRDSDEEFMDYNQDLLFTLGNGMYNGTLCVEGCSSDLIHVRNDIVLTMSGSSAGISIVPGSINLSGLVSVTVTIADIKGNSMPGGTTVALTAPDNADIEGDSTFEIPSNTNGPSSFTFGLKPDGTSAPGTESSLLVKVTSPSGISSTQTATCTTP